MTVFDQLRSDLLDEQKVWLVTGVAGFIGSNLLEELLKLNQKVVGLDNFSTGYKNNLEAVKSLVPIASWENFKFIEGDIRELADCRIACEGVDYVLHQAALGSVPRSINDPILTHDNNISGFLNILCAARDSGVRRLIFAASSSTYGDHPALPKVEDNIGKPLSPYAVTKYVNELYADVFYKTYGLPCIGLRYFNVFGRRQDPNGAYAAVIPKWTASLISGKSVIINGDGETSRDFCYVDNAVQANIIAACSLNKAAVGEVYNVAFGERTTLNELHGLIKAELLKLDAKMKLLKPIYDDFRAGDVRHSLADISKAKHLIGYEPEFSVKAGLGEAVKWFVDEYLLTV